SGPRTDLAPAADPAAIASPSRALLGAPPRVLRHHQAAGLRALRHHAQRAGRHRAHRRPEARARLRARWRRLARRAGHARRGALAHRADGAPREGPRAGIGGRAPPPGARGVSVAGALDGVRVVEVGTLVGASYATKLLADPGADVVKGQPPGGGGSTPPAGPLPRRVPP